MDINKAYINPLYKSTTQHIPDKKIKLTQFKKNNIYLV